MDLTFLANKQKIAIVAIGYNRLDSMKRLLGSLSRAKYTTSVPLVISIDASGCQPLYDYVNGFEWEHGDKYVIIKEQRLGLRDHIIACGELTKYFKAVVILEDDIFVSEYFYDYVLKTVDYYDKDDRISGISLYHPCMDRNLPIDYVLDGNDVFAYQNVESWGQCWTARMWSEFREWYNDTPEHDFQPVDMPSFMKGWKKAWSKFYMAFQIETGRYFIYPSNSLTTCFSEAGEHGNTSSIGQTVLLSGKKSYDLKPFEELTCYDIYGTNREVYQWVGLDEKELCVDFNGTHDNTNNCRYVLSPYTYPYKIVKEFALSLRPIELNVKYALEGKGLYLYDTECRIEKLDDKSYPVSLSYYHIRQMNIHALYKYVYSYTREKLTGKIRKILKS